MHHTILVPDDTRSRLAGYLAKLQSGKKSAGRHLADALASLDLNKLTEAEFQDAFINTKVPQIFAESAVSGDGSDWNLTELGILGDISIAVPVTVFDNGLHTKSVPHAKPFTGTLVFTPGALLRNGMGQTPVDWPEVVRADGTLDPRAYFHLYERRLLPVFQHMNTHAAAHGKQALVTIPGLGCGQFAGPFRGQLGVELQTMLERFLTTHGKSFPNLKTVFFGPYSECSNARQEIHGISLMTRPLLLGNESKPQLCHPTAYEEPGDDFSNCELFSIVAWDHVSWPGNDFFGGSRCTDDGVKAAATDSMRVLTGITGSYHAGQATYLPPAPYRTWEEVVTENDLRL